MFSLDKLKFYLLGFVTLWQKVFNNHLFKTVFFNWNELFILSINIRLNFNLKFLSILPLIFPMIQLQLNSFMFVDLVFAFYYVAFTFFQQFKSKLKTTQFQSKLTCYVSDSIITLIAKKNIKILNVFILLHLKILQMLH